MTPEERRALMLASLELEITTLWPESEDRAKLATIHNATTLTVAKRATDAQAVRVAVASMRDAAEVLRAIPAMLGPDSEIAGLFRRQKSMAAPNRRANEARQAKEAERRARAAALKAQGLRPSAIGRRMALDEKRVWESDEAATEGTAGHHAGDLRPYPPDEVRRWLRPKKP